MLDIHDGMHSNLNIYYIFLDLKMGWFYPIITE
jgi:hypothetical protein